MPTNSAYYIYAEPWERAKSPDKNDSILKLKQEEEEKRRKKGLDKNQKMCLLGRDMSRWCPGQTIPAWAWERGSIDIPDRQRKNKNIQLYLIKKSPRLEIQHVDNKPMEGKREK